MADSPDGPLVADKRLPPFCYQTHAALRALREHFAEADGLKLTTALAVYLCISEAASQEHANGGRNGFMAGRKLIASRAGISVDTLDRYVRALEELSLLGVERRNVGEANLPNLWSLFEPHTPAPQVAAPLRPGSPRECGEGGRAGAAEVLEEEKLERERSTPIAPQKGAPWPSNVDRRPVLLNEGSLAFAILQEFNRVSKRRFSSAGFLAKIIMRIREHPDVTLDGHVAVIEHAFRHPWWKGDPSPSVVYGNDALFERALNAAAAAVAGMDAGSRTLSREEIITYKTEWGPGTPYETLAQARAARAARPELES
jgi:hypothetical protein